jgi:hypothetical protein
MPLDDPDGGDGGDDADGDDAVDADPDFDPDADAADQAAEDGCEPAGDDDAANAQASGLMMPSPPTETQMPEEMSEENRAPEDSQVAERMLSANTATQLDGNTLFLYMRWGLFSNIAKNCV